MRWWNVLDALEAHLKADPFAALVVHADGTPSIGIGIPGVPEAPCVWISRGKNGERDLVLSQDPEPLPGTLSFQVEIWQKVPDAANEAEILRAGALALSELEDAFLAALRRFFSPHRSTFVDLGGYYAATIQQVSPLADDSGGRQVGSLFSIVLNNRRP